MGPVSRGVFVNLGSSISPRTHTLRGIPPPAAAPLDVQANYLNKLLPSWMQAAECAQLGHILGLTAHKLGRQAGICLLCVRAPLKFRWSVGGGAACGGTISQSSWQFANSSGAVHLRKQRGISSRHYRPWGGSGFFWLRDYVVIVSLPSRKWESLRGGRGSTAET